MEKDKRIPSLDLMRALAITLVVTFHYPETGSSAWIINLVNRYGWIGVDVFFVLSGYLISKGLMSEFKKRGDFSFFKFYLKRAFRILPNYWVVVALYFLLPNIAERDHISPLWSFLTFTQNFDLGPSAFSHAWSLCVEEHFYLLLPLLLLPILKAKNLKLTVGAFLSLFIGGMFLRWWLWEQMISPLKGNSTLINLAYLKYLYYPSYSRLDGLLLGVMVSALQVYREKRWNVLTKNYVLLMFIGLSLIVFALWLYSSGKTAYSSIFLFPLLSLGIAGVLISLLSPKNKAYQVSVPGAHFLATMAFSIYLTHKAIIYFVHNIFVKYGFSKFSLVTTLTTVLCMIIGGKLLFTLIENPFLKIRRKRLE